MNFGFRYPFPPPPKGRQKVTLDVGVRLAESGLNGAEEEEEEMLHGSGSRCNFGM